MIAMWKNFIWQREDEPQNMLTYLFLFQNFIYGIAFTFFSSMAAVQRSPYTLNPWLDPWVLGLLCLSLVAVTLYGIATRNRTIGTNVGALGFAVWSYSFILYVLSGSIFAALAIYLPQVLFWVFWGIGVRRFYHKEDQLAER